MSRIGLKGKKMLEIIHDPDYPCIFPFLVQNKNILPFLVQNKNILPFLVQRQYAHPNILSFLVQNKIPLLSWFKTSFLMLHKKTVQKGSNAASIGLISNVYCLISTPLI